MEYYFVIKKDIFLPFTTTWMKLEGIVVRELSQKEKSKYWMTSFICGTDVNQIELVKLES